MWGNLLIQFIVTIEVPLNLKLPEIVDKTVLCKVAEQLLLCSVLKAPKHGFQLPFLEWFAWDFSDFARVAWHSSGTARSGFLDFPAVDMIFTEHRNGDVNHGRILFAITNFSCLRGDEVSHADRMVDTFFSTIQ